MPLSSVMPSEVDEALARGWVTITANQRAARTLRHAYELRRQAAGLESWQPPELFAWESWLQVVYSRMLLDGRASELLLTASQEYTLWAAIVSDDQSTSSLRPVEALAQAAAAAWKLLHSYGARGRLRSYAGNSDTRVFVRWAAEFERRLKRGKYVTAAQLPERLAEEFAGDHLCEAPPGLLLAGFDTTTPAQTAALKAVETAGVEVRSLSPGSPAPNRMLGSAATQRQERLACAQWVRQRLESHPGARIAVIVPSISTLRSEIDREFRAVLAPELNEIGAPAAKAPFEFSLGAPLAQAAMVVAALDVLRWSLGSLPLERISSLLLSPYFAVTDAEERLARAEFDASVLRRQKLLQPRMSMDALHRLAARWQGSPGIAALISHLAALRSAFGAPELSLLGSHADWSETIADMLSAAGWAPAPHLDSAELQTRRKWESVLDELAALDFDDRRVPFPEAIASLEYIARQTLFAPESRHAPVQVVGPLEAAGSQFDAIWFLRANDVEWPTTATPNPLLPWQMQRDLRMPGAIPSQDAELVRAITRRIAASAAEVVFSYAREAPDGPQRPSPALAALELASFEASSLLAGSPAGPGIVAEIVAVESPLPAPPDAVLRGGATVLERQAACAFRAFAEFRLFSAPLDTAVLGLDPGERGSIVHKVLQLFWTRVRSHAELCALSTEARDAVLDDCIRQTIAERQRQPEAGWARAYIDAERQRLANLLRPWLEYEKAQRSPFLVKAVEEEHPDVTIGPLHLHVKIDRIDTSLLHGEPAGDIILDYKTGAANPADWLGNRPDAPQLPLYAVVAGTQDLAAVAFASVQPGVKREMRGFQARGGVLPKTPRQAPGSLTQQVAEWRAVLTSLAQQFHAGRTEVRPKNYPETCKYCQQRLLCRLDVATLSADETEDPDELIVEEEYA